MTQSLRNVVRRLSEASLDFMPNSSLNGGVRAPPALLLEIENLQKALFHSVERNDLDAVTDFIRKHVHVGKIPIDARNENGETPLTVCCRLGNTQLARLFIRSGADVDARDLELWSPLLNAASNGYVDLVQMLVESEADVEQSDVGGWTPLFWAVYKNRLVVVQKLIEFRAEVNVIDEYGMMPLFWAAGRGNSEVVRELLRADARVNARDRFGNSALIWACRKGCLPATMALLSYDAAVDVIGINGATPLILASKLAQVEIVDALLVKNPNVNAVDQSGITALAYAAHGGDPEILEKLLEAGAYVNVADRKKDTVLMKAVKSGEVGVVRALLAKYADVDAQDEEGRTALHLAIDKGYSDILALLVAYKPNTELKTKDGDTALLKAVRNRNIVMVQVLVTAGAKVAVADKRGDTSLHIALRCRSRRLTQILLSRPQDSRILYQPNKLGETPYSIDQSHSQPILPHIFGPAESQVQTEAMLGYDLYSNIVADILCEPMLSLPLTVGLYAKWGSGKSFLLNKLKESLALFSRSWMDMKEMTWSWILAFLIFFVSCIFGIVFYGVFDWIPALSVFVCLLVLSESAYVFIVFGRNRYSRLIKSYLNRHFVSFRLLLQILFYHPPTLSERDLVSCPVGFVFADYHRLSSIGGPQALANIIETLYTELENLYGVFALRLCAAFSPSYSTQREVETRRFCGVPFFAIAGVLILSILLALFLCAAYVHDKGHGPALIAIGGLVLFLCIAFGLYPLGMTMWNACQLRPRREIRKAVSKMDRHLFEGLMQKLSQQVQILEETVHRLDSYSCSQTRLVIFVDGLDSCEHDRMLQTLDAIQVLFVNRRNAPFAVFIAVDPHIVVTAIQKNMSTAFTQTEVSGHDYLKNLIHMPFYLHNSAIQKLHERLVRNRRESIDPSSIRFKTMRDTIYGSYLSLAESRAGSARLRRGVSQNFREGDQQNFGQRIVHDDYFANINPRSMRRVVNTLTLSGRLMRAFEADFNWIILGHWVSLVEQWPFRVSWMIEYCEQQQVPDSATLREVYESIKMRIPTGKSEDVLVELDRNPRNMELYLENNREPVLTVAHLRSFVPFTSNLDPYIRKLIHDKYSGSKVEETSTSIQQQPSSSSFDVLLNASAKTERSSKAATSPAAAAYADIFKDPIFNVKMSYLSVDEVCCLIKRLPLSSSAAADEYCSKLKGSNVSGLVLSFCELDELKAEFRMTFGDWTLFSLMVKTLRQKENDDDFQPYPTSTKTEKSGKDLPSWRRRQRSRSSKTSVPGLDSSSNEMAEISSTHEWLHQRLGYLDSVEFAGDRDLVETPKTSRRSSIIREEIPEDDGMSRNVSVSSIMESEEESEKMKGSNGDLTKSNLSRRLMGLVQAITGTIEETGQLLVHASPTESDTESKEHEEQLTVRKKMAGEGRPSLFELVPPTGVVSGVADQQRALSDSSVNVQKMHHV